MFFAEREREDDWEEDVDVAIFENVTCEIDSTRD